MKLLNCNSLLESDSYVIKNSKIKIIYIKCLIRIVLIDFLHKKNIQDPKQKNNNLGSGLRAPKTIKNTLKNIIIIIKLSENKDEE